MRSIFLFLTIVTVLAQPAFAQEAAAANVSGTITYSGPSAKMRPIDMKVDPTCAEKHGEHPAFNESLVVGESGGLANVFVQIKGIPLETQYPVPAEPVVLSQAGCMYHPRVFGIRPGQELKIRNPDGTMHNVNGMPKLNKGFNLPMNRETDETTVVFDKPEAIFPIKCDVHPWMHAYCAVMSHPFFAVTGEDGKFTIADVPPGAYEVEAWHERLGVQSAKVTVRAAETASVNFVFSR